MTTITVQRSRAKWLCAAWVFITSMLFSAHALAQTFDPTEQPQLDFSAEANKKRVVPASTIKPVSLQVHWNLYKEVVRNGKSGANELNALRDDSISVGRRNLPATTFAAMRLVQQEHEAKTLSLQEASESLDTLHGLSPDLPHPKLARARLLLDDPGNIGQVVSSMRDGWLLAFDWPDTRVPYLFNLTINLLLATVAAGLIFLLAQLLRYFGVISYDFVRLLPVGFSSNQGVIVLLGLIIVPGMLLQSPLLSALILLMLIGVVQQPRERIITLALFTLLLMLPRIEKNLSNALTWSTGSSRDLLQAQYTVCDEPCLEAIKSDRREAGASKDVLLEYTYWSLLYRSGTPARLMGDEGLSEAMVDKWPKSVRGYGYNLIGASRVAMAEPEAAIAPLEKAAALLGKSSPAAYLNLLRAHQMMDDQDKAQAALDRANQINLEDTMLHLNLKRRDINSWLSVPPLPARFFWKRHKIANTQQVDLIARFWPYLAGKQVPLGWATYIGGAGLLLVLLSIPFPMRGVSSTPCPSCGLARDPHDGEETGHHHFCLSCYQTYVAGASMEYEARVTSEETLSARRKMQTIMRRLLSILTPGAGHSTAGYGAFGFITTVAFFYGLLLLLRPGGIWRPPEDLIFLDWMGFGIMGGVLLAISATIGIHGATRDIEPAIIKLARPGEKSKKRDEEAPHDH